MHIHNGGFSTGGIFEQVQAHGLGGRRPNPQGRNPILITYTQRTRVGEKVIEDARNLQTGCIHHLALIVESLHGHLAAQDILVLLERLPGQFSGQYSPSGKGISRGAPDWHRRDRISTGWSPHR